MTALGLDVAAEWNRCGAGADIAASELGCKEGPVTTMMPSKFYIETFVLGTFVSWRMLRWAS
jgi:hypothetical protein